MDIHSRFTHQKRWFSIAMLVYQRVFIDRFSKLPWVDNHGSKPFIDRMTYEKSGLTIHLRSLQLVIYPQWYSHKIYPLLKHHPVAYIPSTYLQFAKLVIYPQWYPNHIAIKYQEDLGCSPHYLPSFHIAFGQLWLATSREAETSGACTSSSRAGQFLVTCLASWKTLGNMGKTMAMNGNSWEQNGEFMGN